MSFKNKHFLIVCLVLGFLPIIPVMFTGSPFLKNDLLHNFYSWFVDFHNNWSFSNPLVFWSSNYQMGMPMYAYWQAGYLYPVTWLFFGVITPTVGIYLFYGFHFFWGIYGFQFLGSDLKLNKMSSLWAGVCFGLSGLVLARYEQPTYMAAYTWMPWVLFTFQRVLFSKTFLSKFLFGLCVGLQCVGGHPQASMVTGILVLLWFFYHLGQSTDKSAKNQLLVQGSVGCLLALGMCLPQLVPFLSFLAETTREQGLNYQEFVSGSLKLKHFLSLALPHFWGSVANGSWWGGELWGEVFLYIGGPGLLFCFYSNPLKGPPWLKGMLLILLIGLWLSLGPLFGAAQILTHIPFLGNLHVPARFSILIIFAMSLISAYGFQNWQESKGGSKIPRVFVAGSVLVLLVFLLLKFYQEPLVQWIEVLKESGKINSQKDYATKLVQIVNGIFLDAVYLAVGSLLVVFLKKPKLKWILLVVLSLDLLRIHWENIYRFPADYYQEAPSSVEFLDKETTPFYRIGHKIDYQELEFWQLHNAPLNHWPLFLREKQALAHGIHVIFGFKHEGVEGPMQWAELSEVPLVEKSTRYFLSNSVPPETAIKLGEREGIGIYEFLNWKPRFEKSSPDSLDLRECLGTGSYLRGLCVEEIHSGFINVSGNFKTGETLVFRERYFSDWQFRVGGGKWKTLRPPENTSMEIKFSTPAETVELRYTPKPFYKGLGYSLLLMLVIYFGNRFIPALKK